MDFVVDHGQCVMCVNATWEAGEQRYPLKGKIISCKVASDGPEAMERVNKQRCCEDFRVDYMLLRDMLIFLDREFLKMMRLRWPRVHSDPPPGAAPGIKGCEVNSYTQEEYMKHQQPFIRLIEDLKGWCVDRVCMYTKP